MLPYRLSLRGIVVSDGMPLPIYLLINYGIRIIGLPTLDYTRHHLVTYNKSKKLIKCYQSLTLEELKLLDIDYLEQSYSLEELGKVIKHITDKELKCYD